MTIRLRLTLVYGLLFVAGGIVLLSLSYTLVRRQLPPKIQVRASSGDLPQASGSEGKDHLLVKPLTADDEEVEALASKLRHETLDELLRQSAAALGITAAAAFGVGWVVAGRALRPVHDITDAARRLGEGNLHQRLALTGPNDEIKELADTFDDMLGRLEAAFERERRFVAHASHELRTPLAVLRAQLEVGGEGAASPEQLLAVLDRSDQVIAGLLLLARSSRVSERQPVDLADVAAVAVAELQPEGTDLEVRTSLDPAIVEGESGLLEQVAINLVANAIQHGTGWLEMSTSLVGHEAVLKVSNGGPRVTLEEAAAYVEPFRRGAGADGGRRATSARGVGLGLAIVSSVVAAHDGWLRIEPIGSGGIEVTVAIDALAANDPIRARVAEVRGWPIGRARDVEPPPMAPFAARDPASCRHEDLGGE